MLKSSFIENHYGEMLEIPNSIEDALLSLYSVDKISDIHCTLRKSIAEKMKMFAGDSNKLLSTLDEYKERRNALKSKYSGDYEAIEELIGNYIKLRDTEKLQEMGARGREYLIRNLTRKVSVEKYRDEILSCR